MEQSLTLSGTLLCSAAVSDLVCVACFLGRVGRGTLDSALFNTAGFLLVSSSSSSWDDIPSTLLFSTPLLLLSGLSSLGDGVMGVMLYRIFFGLPMTMAVLYIRALNNDNGCWDAFERKVVKEV